MTANGRRGLPRFNAGEPAVTSSETLSKGAQHGKDAAAQIIGKEVGRKEGGRKEVRRKEGGHQEVACQEIDDEKVLHQEICARAENSHGAQTGDDAEEDDDPQEEIECSKVRS